MMRRWPSGERPELYLEPRGKGSACFKLIQTLASSYTSTLYVLCVLSFGAKFIILIVQRIDK